MFKHIALILIITFFKDVRCADFDIYPGTYLSSNPSQAYACGSVATQQVLVYSSYFPTVGKTIQNVSSQTYIIAEGFNGIRNTSGFAFANTISANNNTGLQDSQGSFSFGPTTTLFTLSYLPSTFFDARVLTRNLTFTAETNIDVYTIRYSINILKSPINVTTVSPANNYYNSSTCLTIKMQNPCVFIVPTTIFKVTIPKISYPSFPSQEVTPFSSFSTTSCNVSLNGLTNTTKTCSLSGNTLSITNLVTSFMNASELTLSICNIKMNNTRETNAKVELVNSSFTSPSNLYADASFAIPVDIGSILPQYITSEKTIIGNDYYLKFGLSTIENIIINSGSKIEIDFVSVPHAVTSISFIVFSGTTQAQSGNLTCTNKKCSATLNSSYNLKDQFVMSITGLSSIFNSTYDSEFTATFYNSSSKSLLSQTYQLIRTTNDYTASLQDTDIGLSSNLNLTFNNLTLNTSPYDIVFTFGTLAQINSSFFSALNINNKKIASSKITINSTNNTLTVSAINFDSDGIQRFVVYGLYLGPYKAGYSTINFSLKQNNANVYSKDINLSTNVNQFSLENVSKSKIPSGYRFNIGFSYNYPIYANHFFRVGLPKQYIINTANWFRSTQIPYTTAPSISVININMSANLTYYKIYNLLSKADSKSSYSLVFDATLLNVASTGEYIEVDIFSDYPSISGLDNISSSYKISTATSKIISQDCPIGCYTCSGNKDTCTVCSSSLTYNATDGLCYQPNQMNQNITYPNNDNSSIDYMFSTKIIDTFNKILIAVTSNFCVLIIVLGLCLKLFYNESSNLLEFLCASLTLVFSMVTYLFLLRIMSELPKKSNRLELIYICTSASCYIFVNLVVTAYVYLKSRRSNILQNKIFTNFFAKALWLTICSILGVGVSLLFNSFNLLSLYRKLYCDEKDIKMQQSVSLIVKWVASFTILLISASTTLIYYISSVSLPFVYVYLVGSLLLFVAHLISILQINRSQASNHKFYDVHLRHEKNSIVLVRKENNYNQNNNEDLNDEHSIVNNNEINNYLEKIKEFEKNM